LLQAFLKIKRPSSWACCKKTWARAIQTTKVETGDASDDEKSAIDDEMNEQGEGDDSDDIAMSMLDSKAKMAQPAHSRAIWASACA
jgi:hypothetical protein